jgi:hypothetical protein
MLMDGAQAPRVCKALNLGMYACDVGDHPSLPYASW